MKIGPHYVLVGEISALNKTKSEPILFQNENGGSPKEKDQFYKDQLKNKQE